MRLHNKIMTEDIGNIKSTKAVNKWTSFQYMQNFLKSYSQSSMQKVIRLSAAVGLRSRMSDNLCLLGKGKFQKGKTILNPFVRATTSITTVPMAAYTTMGG